MTTESPRAELARRAMLLASDLPDFSVDEAVREIASTPATVRLGEMLEGEIGEVDGMPRDSRVASQQGNRPASRESKRSRLPTGARHARCA